jgi:hypothetical protein
VPARAPGRLNLSTESDEAMATQVTGTTVTTKAPSPEDKTLALFKAYYKREPDAKEWGAYPPAIAREGMRPVEIRLYTGAGKPDQNISAQFEVATGAVAGATSGAASSGGTTGTGAVTTGINGGTSTGAAGTTGSTSTGSTSTPQTNGWPISIGGGLGISFGNSPFGLPKIVVYGAVATIAWLLYKKG